MSWKSAMLGEHLESHTGKIKTDDLCIEGDDVLGLYFSAHWCPPCRGFTPKLVEFYNKFNAKGGRKFQIVFVSADRSPPQFAEYFKEMPWHALPFDEKEKNGELCGKCAVRGIPKLVLFDSSGNKITMKSDARTMVGQDPTGAAYYVRYCQNYMGKCGLRRKTSHFSRVK